MFESGTPQSERQDAVESVNGEVVGGRRLFGDDGYYYVIIEDDHPEIPGQALVGAMEILNSLPQVAGASPVQISSPRVVEPPDSIPSGALTASIYSPENRVSDPRLGDWVPSDVVLVSFDPDASQELRQEAIDLVGGRVIGGVPVHRGAWYIIRIQSDGTAGPLVDAIEALEALPEVRAATPHTAAVIRPGRIPEF